MTPLESGLTRIRDLEREALAILTTSGEAVSELEIVRQRIAVERAELDLLMFGTPPRTADTNL